MIFFSVSPPAGGGAACAAVPLAAADAQSAEWGCCACGGSHGELLAAADARHQWRAVST